MYYYMSAILVDVEFLFNIACLRILPFLTAAKINGKYFVIRREYIDYTFQETIIGALPPEFHGN